MNSTKNQNSAMTYAKIAGLLYLIIAISGGFSIGYMPSVIVEAGNAAKTAQNMMDHLVLFKLGILGDIVVLLLEVVLTVILYRLLNPVNHTIAMIATFSRLAMGVIMGLNLLNYLIPIYLLNGGDHLEAFNKEQLYSLIMVFFEAHQYGVYIWGLFFGLHLVALGYLVHKSGYFPKVLGLLMGVGSLGYLLESVSKITLIDNEILSILIIGFLVLATIGELSFTFWLLIKGINIGEWNKRKMENAV